MPREFKLSRPLDVAAELRKARRESVQADQLAEHAHMRLFAAYRLLKFAKGQQLTPEGEAALKRLDRAAYRLLKFAKGQQLTPEGEAALKRLDRASSALSDVRGELGDAVWQIEKILKEAGEEP